MINYVSTGSLKVKHIAHNNREVGSIPSRSNDLNSRPPLVTPAHIKPEWYFLFVYAILRSIPNKLGGVVALVFSILILLFLPYLHKNRFKGIRFRPSSKVLFGFLVGDFLLLIWVGGQPVEEPYVLIGQIVSLFYFIYFLIWTPLIGNLENKLLKLV